jgi:hypothetical protein
MNPTGMRYTEKYPPIKNAPVGKGLERIRKNIHAVMNPTAIRQKETRKRKKEM